MKETIGTRIARLRRERGMTQEELGERLGVSAQAVSKWENDISCPDILALPALADLLGVSTDELLRGDPQPERASMRPEAEPVDVDGLMLVIRVSSTDGDRVRINLPVPLIKVLLDSGLSLGSVGGDLDRFNIDWAQILSLIDRGVIGKLVEIESADGDTVEITVE